jgi:hypothetical protein
MMKLWTLVPATAARLPDSCISTGYSIIVKVAAHCGIILAWDTQYHRDGMYEQKRISFTAFYSIYDGGYGKEDFWSVNWEHPRVQRIFARIRKFDPSPNAAFMDALEAQAAGKLADNYMVNRSDDGPLPQTLPGIKLQRSFASVIRRFEARTGKRVPADPDYPDHHNIRPSKKSLHEAELGTHVEGVATEVAKPWWRSTGFLISMVVGLLLVAFWIRSWMRPY